jgi:hypothetical protein
LPPVSTTLAGPVAKFSTGVVDTGGYRISSRIFGKIRNDPNVIFRGLGEDDSSKKPEA